MADIYLAPAVYQGECRAGYGIENPRFYSCLHGTHSLVGETDGHTPLGATDSHG